MPGQSWRDTRLWSLLQQSAGNDDLVPQALSNCMPDIETILSQAGTTPLAFTLHDHEHGFRVAERMVQLLPVEVLNRMGSFELALLLLAAYLHDIGMSPRQDVVERHYTYIITSDNNLLSRREISDLQNWLDRERDGLRLPVSNDAITAEDVTLADDLVAYYCRYRHNDWSEVWIRDNLSTLKPALYANWIDDLITLCRSHHDSLRALRGDRFNLRIAGSPSQVVNLRYLAALLRLADVMEFDPERTPSVILKHRAIPPKSRIYWYKDEEISLKVDVEKHHIIFAARTPNAHVHRAVLETANWVDNELLCCSTLSSEGAFSRGMVPDENRLYVWPWPPKLNLDVVERDESFVYIDGAFRPDAKRILSLLSGTALYGNLMVAVRELLQNAVDAVREQIALERLTQDDPSDRKWSDILGAIHKITLHIVKDSDGYWLICSDDGIGMTRDLIEKHLLVSGSPVRADVRALEREAEWHGFVVGRTGEFGIGVLSYFMIADRMVINTRRSADAGDDPDHTAWQFVTDGLDGFGQLSRLNRSTKGTEVRLRLRAEVISSGAPEWYDRLKTYIERTLRHLPCRFEMRFENEDRELLKLCPGWTTEPLSLSGRALQTFRPKLPYGKDDDLIPADEQEKRTQVRTRWAELREAAAGCLHWHGPAEGELDEGYGRYRVHLPYFKLPGGASLAFLDIDKEGKGRELAELADAVFASGDVMHSWRGFSCSWEMTWSLEELEGQPGLASYFDFVVEIDWLKGGRIAVDRGRLLIDRGVEEKVAAELHGVAESLALEFLHEHRESHFGIINHSRIAEWFPNRALIRPTKAFFKHRAHANRPTGKFLWKEVSYPAAEIVWGDRTNVPPYDILTIAGRQVVEVTPLALHDYDKFVLPMRGLPCDRLVVVKLRRGGMPVPLWESAPGVDCAAASLTSHIAALPPGWDKVCTVAMRHKVILNTNHDLLRVVDEEAWNWVNRMAGRAGDPRGCKSELLRSRSRAAAWLLRCSRMGSRFWNGLRDQERDFLETTLRLAFGDDENPSARKLYVWHCDRAFYGSSETAMISADGLRGTRRELAYLLESLSFADGFVLPWPQASEWRVELRKVGQA